jgi:hypothetical protein
MGQLARRYVAVELPCERATDATYLQLYVHSILALQARSAGEMPAKRSAKDVGIPLAIMTSVGARCTRRFQLRPIALESAWFPTLEEVESS